ncbi:hypothetical protein ABW19_dt0206011 [Dactylella cylindrospora]|nr:hypothetical protein ABW19_dt0206011 [Dactylella cylindrospora]
MAEQTPRVNANLLDRFVGSTVRITGKVTSLRGETATIDSQGTVTINLQRGSHLALDHVAEIIGKVNTDGTIMVLVATDFGANVDMDMVDAVVQATHTYPEIFYNAGQK